MNRRTEVLMLREVPPGMKAVIFDGRSRSELGDKCRRLHHR